MATAINFIRYWRYTYGEIPHQRVIEFCAGVSSADTKRALEYFRRREEGEYGRRCKETS